MAGKRKMNIFLKIMKLLLNGLMRQMKRISKISFMTYMDLGEKFYLMMELLLRKDITVKDYSSSVLQLLFQHFLKISETYSKSRSSLNSS